MALGKAILEDLLMVVVSYRAYRRALGDERRDDLDALRKQLEEELRHLSKDER